jgi:prepilin-type N-terminal cleavage/methylation domain-containing protein
MNFKKSKGFTLIELLVVVAIISLLTSVVFASVREARDKARGTAFRQEVNEFIKALELYRADNDGNLPQGFIYMQNDWMSGSDEVDGRDGESYGATAKQAIYPYIKKFPQPPFTGGFGYVGGDLISYNAPCGSSNYFLQVEGVDNIEYFSNWINTTAQLYDNDFGVYKCFPLDNVTIRQPLNLAGLGESCSSNPDCESGFCGYSLEPGNPQVCTDGSSGGNNLCTSGDQCASGYCDPISFTCADL